MARSFKELMEEWKSSPYYVPNIADGQSSRYKYYNWVNSLSPEDREVVLNNGILTAPGFRDEYDTYNQFQNVVNGTSTPEDFQAYIGGSGTTDFYTPEMEQYINNELANQRTNEAREWEQYVGQNQYLWSGQQAQQLGLSPSVIAFGSSSVNPVGTADVSMKNLGQERAMEKYNQRMGLAKQLIGMTGSMASAGIYGKAIGTAKRASSLLASSAAHSGLMALKTSSGRSYADVINGMMNK